VWAAEAHSLKAASPGAVELDTPGAVPSAEQSFLDVAAAAQEAWSASLPRAAQESALQEQKALMAAW
jgi:hypothetical protein